MRLLGTAYAKRGSAPTDLAEFFVVRIAPVLQDGCSPEVSQKILKAGPAITLRACSLGDLLRGM